MALCGLLRGTEHQRCNARLRVSDAGAGAIGSDAAAVTRRRVFDMVATDRLAITGMHLHFPGFAHLVRRGSGSLYADHSTIHV